MASGIRSPAVRCKAQWREMAECPSSTRASRFSSSVTKGANATPRPCDSRSSLTTRPAVIAGPDSPGQLRTSGKPARLTSRPRWTTCWHSPVLVALGRNLSAPEASPVIFSRSNQFCGVCSATSDSRRPGSASSDSIARARHARAAVPSRFVTTAMDCPRTRSNSRAGPPSAATRRVISAISRSGSTSALTRTSSSAAASSSRKSANDLYGMRPIVAVSRKSWQTRLALAGGLLKLRSHRGPRGHREKKSRTGRRRKLRFRRHL